MQRWFKFLQNILYIANNSHSKKHWIESAPYLVSLTRMPLGNLIIFHFILRRAFAPRFPAAVSVLKSLQRGLEIFLNTRVALSWRREKQSACFIHVRVKRLELNWKGVKSIHTSYTFCFRCTTFQNQIASPTLYNSLIKK